MCKENFIHVAFIIDESGSMSGSETDIVGGFNKTIEEQKAIKDGKCAVSFFSFNDIIKERFIGKDVNEVQNLEKGNLNSEWTHYSSTKYISITSTVINAVADIDIKAEAKETNPLYQYTPRGCTAMNDGIGTAIDKIGKWLSDMPEDERPSKNLIVIMTDGEENSSKEYTLSKVQEMIKHQTEKYDWTFVYMGMDITNKQAADDLGIKSCSFVSKDSESLYKNYSNISNSASCYRASAPGIDASEAMETYLINELDIDTTCYEAKTGIKIK
jgi:uncharacterized protein YegL